MDYRVVCLAVLLLAAACVSAADFSVTPHPQGPLVERVGPPTAYLQHLARYKEPIPGPGKYPIPTDPVNRETYYQWLADSGHFAYAEGDRPTRHGRIGPRHFMPVLAKYVKTGDPEMGQALLTMLHHFDKWLRQEIEQVGYHSWFQDETIYLGLYMRYLEEGGLLHREDPWFRDMVLTFIDALRGWGNEMVFWRGPMHRSQAEGINRYLGAMWYPDAPQAEEWKRYAGIVYRDFWDFKDLATNDTGYLFVALWPLTVGAHLKGDEEFFNHPEMQRLWERLMYEVSPDGSVTPYGGGGWNINVGARIAILEIVARHTGDGRYRWVAHRLMNYLRYQQEYYWRNHWLAGPDTTEKLAVAYLLADESIAPVQPDSGSILLYRKEAIGVRSKEAGARRGWYKDVDPAPDRHELSSPLTLLDNVKPSKLVLRSGWNPGDFFVLVDLYPRHAPLNPGALLGMTRWGAGLGWVVTPPFHGRDNRLLLEDLAGTAEPRHTTDPDLVVYRLTSETEIPLFTDQARATFATITVSNYEGFPVSYEREFAFIKNRFLVTREIAEFEQGFLALLAPSWATQNVGPQIGTHWANTYLDELRASTSPLRNPPYDLLVWFAPRADCAMQVVARCARTADVPWEVRYAWRGATQPGQRVHFTQVYYPHPPSLQRPTSNVPGAASTADLLGTAGADGIHLLRDDLECTVLRFTFDADREEWVVINPGGVSLSEGDLATDAHYLYLDVQKGEVKSVSAMGAGFLTLRGQEIFRQAERGEVER